MRATIPILALTLVAAQSPGDEQPAVRTSVFAGADLAPSPACLAVAPTGEVFVGVDTIGSLGKQGGRGRVVRLVDSDHDGVVDSHTTFAILDNPRGLLPLGDELFVLHTTFGPNPDHVEGSEGEDGQLAEVATGMDLVAYTDADRDGIADGPPRLLFHNISTPKFVAGRGTDHATNGITMGIDGWIYIAVGDFGFHGAVDAEGNEHTMLGGGVWRIRPDGTEAELYTHGLRNIYDVAIDPFLNVFTRGNTNDGGGWNVRFVHHLQTGQYGYPTLFKHFTHETLPALVDVGGGSGTGALFLDDDRWPDGWDDTPLMADWGRSKLFAHRVTPDGASFRQREEALLDVPQITDLGIDASGVMYLAAWDGAGYWGNPEKGHVVRAVPAEMEPGGHPRVQDLELEQLVELLRAPSAVARLDASQELVRRAAATRAAAAEGTEAPVLPDIVAGRLIPLFEDQGASLASRVAALFTFAQVQGELGVPTLYEATDDPALVEFALRALADRRDWFDLVPPEAFQEFLPHDDTRVRAAAIIGLGRIAGRDAWVAPPGSTTVALRERAHVDHAEIAAALLATPMPADLVPPAAGAEGPHAAPDADRIEAHLAAQALVAMDAVDACLVEADGQHGRMARWVLSRIHTEASVQGLIAAYDWAITGWDAGTPKGEALERELLIALARLAHREAPYDGSWWWNTRPDTHGPYYKREAWEWTEPILSHLGDVAADAEDHERPFLAWLNERFRLGFEALELPEHLRDAELEPVDFAPEPDVDLEAIAAGEGEVGRLSIEDALIAVKGLEGDVANGRALFTRQGCVACHTLTAEEPPKGPYMGQVGSVLDREAIATSILRPSASISQGFSTVRVTTEAGTHVGFVTAESATELELRDITGRVTELQVADITGREELDSSMMPPGLANALTAQELADLVDFLVGQTE